MSQTYCRPVEGVKILGVEGPFIHVGAGTGRYTVGPGIMVHLRGENVVHEWAGPNGRRVSTDMVGQLKDNELLVDERGEVHVAGNVRRQG